MSIDEYKSFFNRYFSSDEFHSSHEAAKSIIEQSRRIFFVGNGGSNAVSSHMAEDYQKMGRFPTFSFSDAALITCYANDYGYERAMAEWLKLHLQEGDTLIAISSSGESPNILNAARLAVERDQPCVTLSGFAPGNTLSTLGRVNFHLPSTSYGIVECFHQVVLHTILDDIVAFREAN